MRWVFIERLNQFGWEFDVTLNVGGDGNLNLVNILMAMNSDAVEAIIQKQITLENYEGASLIKLALKSI